MSDVTILFGRPHVPQLAEDRFEIDVLAAEELGIESYAIPLDPVVNGEPERALRRLPRPRHRTWLYRGWMLSEEEYTGLYEAMQDRGEELVVDPESFAEAMYMPNYLPLLGDKTAPTRWTEGEDIREAWEAALELGPPPWVVKDHVKSVKELWHRACFVPEGATYDDFADVCEKILERRGDRFERGFVVRKYLDLATLPGWAPGQRRVTDEHRLVFWEGRLAAHAPYYDVDSTLERPAQFAYLGQVIGSPFFTADVARLERGGYTVIEINDGGCSVFPEQMDPRDFYGAVLD
ncbi:ATP-grasp domain-containing protein [Sorangium sp. So ce448]|uniref:ATP-grasp domain-containing protein n=1 Tax=Sorangium sp. So ce448 TaxID=3133314 RepID=UPI003F646EC6